MTYKGSVRDGVIVLEPGAELPEGAHVRVELESSDPPGETQEDSVFSMAELAVETGIPDLATNVDHYLYGHPKASDGR